MQHHITEFQTKLATRTELISQNFKKNIHAQNTHNRISGRNEPQNTLGEQPDPTPNTNAMNPKTHSENNPTQPNPQHKRNTRNISLSNKLMIRVITMEN